MEDFLLSKIWKLSKLKSSNWAFNKTLCIRATRKDLVKISWNDIKNQDTRGGSSGSGSGLNYVKLEVGTTAIRVVGDEPYSRWTHWIPEANGGKGMGVDCIGKGCPVCAKMAEDKKAKVKSKYSSRRVHSINVIVHEKPGVKGLKEIAVLEAGQKVFNGLLVLLEQMGDLKNYDVKIVKSGTDFNNTDYNVLPTFPPSPLSAEEAALPHFTLEQIKKEFTTDQIKLLMTGATYESVFGSGDATTTGSAGVDFTRPV